MITPSLTVKGGKMTVLVPISPNSRTRCEPRTHRLTISERREFEKQKKEARFEEYIRLMERYELKSISRGYPKIGYHL